MISAVLDVVVAVQRRRSLSVPGVEQVTEDIGGDAHDKF